MLCKSYFVAGTVILEVRDGLPPSVIRVGVSSAMRAYHRSAVPCLGGDPTRPGFWTLALNEGSRQPVPEPLTRSWLYFLGRAALSALLSCYPQSRPSRSSSRL